MWLFGAKFVFAIRWIQFALGFGTACFCGRTSAVLFGENAGQASFSSPCFFLLFGAISLSN
jgi:hypothetical protein